MIKTRKIKFKGRILEVVTIKELGEIVGRKPNTLREMENKNTLPMANLRTKACSNGEPGKRLYTKKLAEQLKPLFAKIQKGVAIPEKVTQQINIAFQEEKIFINSEIQNDDAT